ncbi:hypothetical protein BDN70DRAFT_602230 [Pholiota conissans]|uniref:Uncharacterized protein n=1 Tax=Pholiota conissans TaxID=109636 RepID=A0A9P5YJU9_9AGAR|nr:hypothetical protein BDN70DRAFT_602230 [Pholiota conissans]
MPSNRYQEGTSSREWASRPDAPSRSSQPRTKEHGRRLDNSSDDWGDDDEPNLRNESAPKTYSHNSQRSRVNTLAPPSSSWTGKEGDFTYGSPPTSQSMSSSTETLRPDNTHRPPKKKYQDSGPSQEYDGPWVSETKDYGSAPPALSGNPSSLPPVVSKPSRSTSLPTSSLPSQPIPITQSGRSVSQIPQGSSTYGIQYGSALDSRDHHTPSDFQGNFMHGSLPTRPPALTRGVSDPPRQSQGESWHNIPPAAIQPQTSSRNRPRQDEKADKTWPAPANQSYGFNPSGGGGSSSSSSNNNNNNNNNNRGVGDERTVSGRSNMSQPSTRSIPLPNAPQYSNQVAPGTWSGPTSTSPPGAMFPGPAIFPQPQPFAGNYEQDLSQRFAQTSMNNSSRMPLGTIPEVQQQSVVNSKPSLHRPDVSVTSLLTTSTSTIPDKYISIARICLLYALNLSRDFKPSAGEEGSRPIQTTTFRCI